MSNGSLSPLMQLRPAQALEWFVIVETGTLAGHRFPIAGGGLLTLGRDPGCTLKFDPNQERMVGRRHAHIEVRDDGVYLVDDSSANGTFKNGQPISEVRLQHGDRFQLGGEVEGAQGPWVLIHMPVAVHVTPPRAEVATLITRPSPSLQTTIPPAAAIPSSPAVSPLPPLAPVSALPVSTAAELAYVQPSAERAPIIEPTAPSVGLDPQLSLRRSQLFRQVAGIVLLLIVACTVGVLLGLRQDGDRDSESTTRLQD